MTDGAARIALGLATELPMGNLDAERDWGFAGDYVRAMWLMLQQPEPSDYVVATGVGHSVASSAGSPSRASGSTTSATCAVDPALYRPAEVDHLLGDASKARPSSAGSRPSRSSR